MMTIGDLAQTSSTTLVLALALALLTGCPDRPEPEEPEPEPEPEVEEFELVGDAEAGAPIYAAQCASCHGDTGEGDGPAGAALDPEPSDLTETDLTPEEIYIITRDGGPALDQSPLMAPFGPALDEQELHDVTAYVVALADGDANPNPSDSDTDDEADAGAAEEGDSGADDEN